MSLFMLFICKIKNKDGMEEMDNADALLSIESPVRMSIDYTTDEKEI